MTPRWFQLMRAQQIRGRTALTFPFFVGCSRPSLALVTVSPEHARKEIYALLYSFLEDCPANHAVSIFQCHDIDQPVAIQFFSLYSAPNAAALESQSQGRATLFIASELAPFGGSSLASLTERFFADFHAHICASRFSYILGDYAHFTADDRNFIEFSRSL